MIHRIPVIVIHVIVVFIILLFTRSRQNKIYKSQGTSVIEGGYAASSGIKRHQYTMNSSTQDIIVSQQDPYTLLIEVTDKHTGDVINILEEITLIDTAARI